MVPSFACSWACYSLKWKTGISSRGFPRRNTIVFYLVSLNYSWRLSHSNMLASFFATVILITCFQILTIPFILWVLVWLSKLRKISRVMTSPYWICDYFNVCGFRWISLFQWVVQCTCFKNLGYQRLKFLNCVCPCIRLMVQPWLVSRYKYTSNWTFIVC